MPPSWPGPDNGGNGGKISLAYTSLNAPTNLFYICSGTPGAGGNGSFGVPAGSGGAAGSWGFRGSLYKNGALQPTTLRHRSPVNGNPGSGLPICTEGN